MTTLFDQIKEGDYGNVIRYILENNLLEKANEDDKKTLENDVGMNVSEFQNTLNSAIDLMDKTLSVEQTNLLMCAQVKNNPKLESMFLQAAIDERKIK